MTRAYYNGSRIVVWFSCGAASAVAAKATLEDYPDARVRVVNNPIAEEDPDNARFLHDVQDWLGVEIEYATNPRYPSNACVDVWDHRGVMSVPHGAPCTVSLKKRARQLWEDKNPHDYVVLGFTLDERKRHERFVLTERDNVLPVLIDRRMTKQDCVDYLQAEGLTLPRAYSLGYPNANCIGCVKATSPTYWNLVRETHPEVFAQRAEQSRRLGARLARVKNKRVFLDELDPQAIGRPLKTMAIECGIFCEEPEE